MTSIVLGYILAVTSALFHTLYIIPRKLSKQKPIYYIFYMGIGFLLSSVLLCIVCLCLHIELDLVNPILIYAIIAGILSMIASISVVIAIDKIGLSRSNQWKNLQGPIGAMLIFLFFSEGTNTKILLLLIAIAAIFTSAILLTIKQGKEKIDKKGILYALIAAIAYGINALMRKYTSDANLIYEQQLYSSFFMFLSASVYILIKDKNIRKIGSIKKKDNKLAILAGAIYYFAVYFYIIAYKYIQGSIAYTIVQLNAVFTIFLGIFVFKELAFRKNWLRITIGTLLAVIGLFILMLAQK